MGVGSAVSVFLKERIHGALRALGQKKLGYFGIFVSSVLGVASPLCMYGTIPIAASFSRSGVRDDWLAAFMMSSILLNPQLIIYSASLGGTVLIVRILSCFLCGMMAGLCVRWFYKEKLFFISLALQNPQAGIRIPISCCGISKMYGEISKPPRHIFCLGLFCPPSSSVMCQQRL